MTEKVQFSGETLDFQMRHWKGDRGLLSRTGPFQQLNGNEGMERHSCKNGFENPEFSNNFVCFLHYFPHIDEL